MKKTLLIVLAILVMVTLGVAQDSTTKPNSAPATSTFFNADGNAGHVAHGCMLCHAPHSANASISSLAVTPLCFGGPCTTDGGFNPGNFAPAPGYTGGVITSIATGNSGGPVAGSIYLWGTALTAQTYTTWDGHPISQGSIGTAGKNAAVVHTLLCMSCHDNANSGYMMGSGFGKGPGTELGTGNPVTDGYGEHIGLSQIINPSGPAVWSNASSLSNTHPVDVAYTSGGHNWLINPTDGTFQDSTFQMDAAGHKGHPAKLWVDGGNGSGGAAMVECTSCHDPHRETAFAYWNGTNYTIGGTGSTVYYLRGPYTDPKTGNGNVNANFCRSCHYSKSEAYANNNGGPL